MEEYLSHHGVKGQKWGVQHGPPYPLGSNVSTGKSLKVGAGRDISVKKTAQTGKIGKKKTPVKHIETPEEHEARRQEVIKKGTPQEVQKFKGEISAEEYREILQRFRDEESLRDYVRKTTPKSKSDVFFQNLEDKTKKATKLTEAYNVFARIANAVSQIKLPVIPTQEQALKMYTDQVKKNNEEAKKGAQREDRQNQKAVEKVEKQANKQEKIERKNEQNGENNKPKITQDDVDRAKAEYDHKIENMKNQQEQQLAARQRKLEAMQAERDRVQAEIKKYQEAAKNQTKTESKSESRSESKTEIPKKEPQPTQSISKDSYSDYVKTSTAQKKAKLESEIRSIENQMINKDTMSYDKYQKLASELYYLRLQEDEL